MYVDIYANVQLSEQIWKIVYIKPINFDYLWPKFFNSNRENG